MTRNNKLCETTNGQRLLVKDTQDRSDSFMLRTQRLSVIDVVRMKIDPVK
jgi:hypothetical protein